MQTDIEIQSPNPHLSRVATILGIAGWLSFLIQVGLAATTGVLLLLAVSGRNFNQAIALPVGVPGTVIAPTQSTANITGVTAHFVAAIAALSVFNWLHRPSDPV